MSTPATARYVIVHTDERGETHTLSTIIYTDLADVHKRVAHRRHAAAIHGWPDQYEVYALTPVDEVTP